VAESGLLVTRVIYLKEAAAHRFAIVDAGMGHLLRPALYGAHHRVLPVREPATAETVLADIVGPICESSDVLARGRALPPLIAGELLAFATAGAYGSVMASNYNSLPSAAEVLVDGARWAVIKPRREAEAQFADEVIPGWLRPGPD
jgi:diaminopimelate decarboxylase